MGKQPWDWPSDLTPARRARRRPASATAGSAGTPGGGDLAEAIEKLADQLRRLETKVDVIHEQLLGLAGGEQTRAEINRVQMTLRRSSSAAAAAVAREPRKRNADKSDTDASA